VIKPDLIKKCGGRLEDSKTSYSAAALSGKRLSFQGTVACSAMVSRGFEYARRPGAFFYMMDYNS